MGTSKQHNNLYQPQSDARPLAVFLGSPGLVHQFARHSKNSMKEMEHWFSLLKFHMKLEEWIIQETNKSKCIK